MSLLLGLAIFPLTAELNEAGTYATSVAWKVTGELGALSFGKRRRGDLLNLDGKVNGLGDDVGHGVKYKGRK